MTTAKNGTDSPLGLMQRRELLRSLAMAGLATAAWPTLAAGTAEAGDKAGARPDPWTEAQAIVDALAQQQPFRDEDFNVTAFGAKPCALVPVQAYVGHENKATVQTQAPDAFDCHASIAAAIEACHKAGGGRVLIPAGNWFCAGPIALRSHVNVHLAAGAQVLFSTEPADYARYGDFDAGANGRLVRSRWQANDCLNFSALIYARGQQHIALTGEDETSILNGQGGVPNRSGECWWDWKGRHGGHSEGGLNPLNVATLATLAPGLDEAQRRLIQGAGEQWRGDAAYLPMQSEAGIPAEKRVFGLGHFLPPPMVQLLDCEDVLLQNYQTTQTPFWQHNPINCRRLVFRNVFANSLGPNNDGFDPESCDMVLAEGCQFNTGDDCIAIKAGKNLDGQYGPSRRMVIQHCVMQSGHGGLTLGSEVAGGIEKIYAQHLQMQNLNWKTSALNVALRFKTNMNRGGFIRDVHIRHVDLPNGVETRPSFYKPMPGSPVPERTVASGAGGVITIDCDYIPAADSVRTRPPVVENIHISHVKVGNVETPRGLFSCYQALVIQGPVASDYNGADPAHHPVLPVSGVTISDCQFGTPANTAKPYYLYNARDVSLARVEIAGQVLNQVLSA